jgi:hypothetical protein
VISPAPCFDHLVRLTDGGGLFEHALRTAPRPEHGYCVDDVARALVVLCREPGPTPPGLRTQFTEFVLAAEDGGGRFRNRRRADRSWHGQHGVEDCWGRALWALGAAGTGDDEVTNRCVLDAFDRGAALRSPHSRAMAFAGLGAAEVVRAHPGHARARALLADAADRCAGSGGGAWPWPESRLTYANAVIPEVLIAAGVALDHPVHLETGLALLDWLLTRETRGGHLSVTPVGGRGPGDRVAGFDQQPIEVAALADACARAFAHTGERRWAHGIELCATWFHGKNDSGVVMFDAVGGGGFDGLEIAGRNENQGAESTLAWLSTLQQARWLSLCAR